MLLFHSCHFLPQVGDGDEVDKGTDPKKWETDGKHTVTAEFTPKGAGGAAAINGSGGGMSKGVIPIVAMAACTLFIGLILLLVGAKNRNKRLNMREDEFSLRKNADMLPYDFEEATEYSGSDDSNMVHVVGEKSALGLSDARALAASDVHKCQSAACPTCTLVGKEPAFVDVGADIAPPPPPPPPPPSELHQNNFERVAGASNDARAAETMVALSFATGSIVSSDESSLGQKSAGPPDIYYYERRQRNDDLSVMATDDAERSYEKGDTVDF